MKPFAITKLRANGAELEDIRDAPGNHKLEKSLIYAHNDQVNHELSLML